MPKVTNLRALQVSQFCSIDPQDGVLYIRQKEDVITFFGDKFSNGDKVVSVGTQVTIQRRRMDL